MNQTINNTVTVVGTYTGVVVRKVTGVFDTIVSYAAIVGDAIKKGASVAARYMGINKHTAIVGTAAAVIAGAATHAGASATIIGATAAVGLWAAAVAIPLMALYVTIARLLGHSMSYYEMVGATTVSMLVPMAAVYGGLLVAYAVQTVCYLTTLAWYKAAVLFVL